MTISKDVPTYTTTAGSTIMQPVEIQGRYASTIQTHNAVSVPGTAGTSLSAWIDVTGYDGLAITLRNDAATNSYVDISWSHDGATIQGSETVLAVAIAQYRTVYVPTKARYAQIKLGNTDAAAHTMSAWAYLKS
jgi:hypothetical protein